jgi:hypothetical protein
MSLQDLTMKPKTLSWLLAVPLFAVALVMYANALPPSFNTRYENRVFFDSDGEFITRQFREGSIYTHNDHLLYHVLAKEVVRLAPPAAGGKPDIVGSHLALSVFFGALGIVMLYLGGLWLGGDPRATLASAVLLSGTAGYWFFSATIDTYVPHLWAAMVALLLSLKCLRDQRLVDYGWLGLVAAVAFLFRTDAALLATLGIVAFADRPTLSVAFRRLGLCAGVVAVIGFGGYALLANIYYGVAVEHVFSWMFDFHGRPFRCLHTPPTPGTQVVLCGKIHNLTAHSLFLSVINHLSYAVVIPGVENTRSIRALDHYGALGPGLVSWATWVVMGLVMAIDLAVSAARKNAGHVRWVLALVAAWIVPRVAFYCWWDPGDPFLFAVMSLPGVWLIAFGFAVYGGGSARSGNLSCRWVFVLLLAIIVWLHNFQYLIGVLRTHA